MAKIRTVVRDLLTRGGIYRPGQWTRLVSHAARRQFKLNKEFYRALLPPNALVFDVGANIGERTEELLAAGARVVAFEPQRRCLNQLQARCRTNADRLVAVESAVGSTPGSANLFVTENSAVSSFASNWVDAPKTAQKVSVTTLDLAIERYGLPYYCKIDVEGWELEVLKGLRQSLPLLSLEYHDQPEDLLKTRQCLDYLASLAEIEINVTPAEVLQFRSNNWMPADEFEKVVEHEIRGCYAKRYGDIFVRPAAPLR